MGCLCVCVCVLGGCVPVCVRPCVCVENGVGPFRVPQVVQATLEALAALVRTCQTPFQAAIAHTFPGLVSHLAPGANVVNAAKAREIATSLATVYGHNEVVTWCQNLVMNGTEVSDRIYRE